jgi:hypothetical protein
MLRACGLGRNAPDTGEETRHHATVSMSARTLRDVALAEGWDFQFGKCLARKASPCSRMK